MSKANPAVIGGFVIGAIALIVIGLLVYGGAGWFVQRNKYVAYFPGSVKGLLVGAPVDFRGVTIGQVTEIRVLFNPQRRGREHSGSHGAQPDPDRGHRRRARRLGARGRRASDQCRSARPVAVPESADRVAVRQSGLPQGCAGTAGRRRRALSRDPDHSFRLRAAAADRRRHRRAAAGSGRPPGRRLDQHRRGAGAEPGRHPQDRGGRRRHCGGDQESDAGGGARSWPTLRMRAARSDARPRPWIRSCRATARRSAP